MVNHFNIKCNGVYQWLLVRISSIIILLYCVYLLSFIWKNKDLITYEMWYDFFSKNTTKIFSLMSLFSILLHGWIGLFHILDDYIKHLILKRTLQLIVITISVIYFICGINMFWNM